MSFPRSYVMLLLAVCAAPLPADQTTGDEELYLEFLEFLGSWESEDGEWNDPNIFMGDVPDEVSGTQDEDIWQAPADPGTASDEPDSEAK